MKKHDHREFDSQPKNRKILVGSVTNLFYRLFYHMEYISILDSANEEQLFALHYVFIPRISLALSHFRAGWNNHSIRTEHNLSPEQLFTAGVLRLQRCGLIALDFINNVSDDYGTSEDGLPPSTDDYSGVKVPEVGFAIETEQYRILQQTVDTSRESNNYGIDLYEETHYENF